MFFFNSQTARRFIVIAILCVVLVVSAAGAFVNVRRTDKAIRLSLATRSSTIAYLLNKSEVSQLTGKVSDIDNPAYQDLKKTLSDLSDFRTANADVRSLYITVKKDNKLYFYVDSEQPSSRYYSPPGEYYPDATPLFKSVFTEGITAVEGPQKDDYGSWVSGLAPIKAANGKTVAVLGIDIATDDYYSSLVKAAALPALLGIVGFVVVLAYEIIRRRDEHYLKVQSELVSIASHELRSPLSGVRWAAESLKAHSQDENKHIADQILTSATSLQASIDNILELGSFGSRKRQHLDSKDTDIAAIIHDICDTQQLAASQKSVRIALDSGWNEPIIVKCDPSRIKQAFHNIISNAIKYTNPDTTVTVEYSSTPSTHCISVKDEGIGIPKSEQHKIFQGFYRATNTQGSGISGTGLGLYMTRSIIRRHGGDVKIDSQPNAGTTILITLPR